MNQLNALLEDTANALPLINGLKTGMKRRFDDMNNNTDAQPAAADHPQFKLYWLSDEVHEATACDDIEATYR